MTPNHNPLLVYVYALEVSDESLARALARSLRRDRAARRTTSLIARALGLLGRAD